MSKIQVPDLPDGVERDPVRKQDDFGENADVYGLFASVSVQVRINSVHLCRLLHGSSSISDALAIETSDSGDQLWLRFTAVSWVGYEAIQMHPFGSLKVC